jgi:hypothetical protein
MTRFYKNSNSGSGQLAYTARDFGELFGKQPCWVRRLIHQKKIRAIKDFGEWLIPASEIDVVLDSAQPCKKGGIGQ